LSKHLSGLPWKISTENPQVANPALCSMLGYQDDELAGIFQFANPEDSQDDWALF
jgi:hypothetical protein